MTADAKRSQGRLKIRWGRLSVAAIGALALVGAPVFLVLAALTPMSWWWPLASVLIAFGTLVTLRTWAVQERRQEAWKRAAEEVAAQHEQEAAETDEQSEAATDASEAAAETEASGELDDAQESAETETAERNTEQAVAEAEADDAPFDVDGDADGGAEPAATDADAETEAETESTAEAEAEVGAEAEAAEEASGSEEAKRVAEATKAGKGWVPSKVPAPGYASKAEARREKAEPFQAEEKKPEEVTSIRKSERARAERERHQNALDLDDIMNRRRA